MIFAASMKSHAPMEPRKQALIVGPLETNIRLENVCITNM